MAPFGWGQAGFPFELDHQIFRVLEPRIFGNLPDRAVRVAKQDLDSRES